MIPPPDQVLLDRDVVTASTARAMHGLFDAPGDPPGDNDPLPPLWHWMAFLPRVAHREMGSDGHPYLATSLLSYEDARRMFAGARLTFLGVARVGEALSRRSWLKSLERKVGRTGELVFATVAFEISNEAGIVIAEEQDIVYRPRTASGHMEQSPANTEEWTWRLKLPTDPVTLFRYSALTYNAHRIHYDRDYATHEEGYPGLVVQGPLQAVGLAEIVRRFATGQVLHEMSFRALRPAFGGSPLSLCGRAEEDGVTLVALDESSRVTVQAHASLRD